MLGARAAVQLARRAHALAACDPDADWFGVEAGIRKRPWTPYRVCAAMVEAGIPARSIVNLSRRSRRRRCGADILQSCDDLRRQATVEQYKGNPRVQVHGPGFSKILLGDDVVDQWEEYLDLMVESVYSNGGRSCINARASGPRDIPRRLQRRLPSDSARSKSNRPTDPEAGLAAFTVSGAAAAIWKRSKPASAKIGVTHVTEAFGPDSSRKNAVPTCGRQSSTASTA